MATVPLVDVGVLLAAVLAATIAVVLLEAPLLASIRSDTTAVRMATP